MMSQPTIWKQSPDSYHMHNDMPEPEIINLEYDDVDENIENDTLALFNSIEDSIWNTLPLWNSRLREKMCQVVHLNVVEVLTLLVLPIDPDSERYHTLYACLFHALVLKKVAWKTSDSCACMPSMTAIDDYLLPSVAMAQPMFLSENGHCVPNKIPKILKLFKGVEGAKSQGACFSTKELDHPFLSYLYGFDLAHGLAPNQSHVNNPGMDDPIP